MDKAERDRLRLKVLEDKDLWLQWGEHPVTKLLRDYLHQEREARKEMWANGGFAAPSVEELAIRQSAAHGYCDALREVLDLQFDQLVSAENEANNE